MVRAAICHYSLWFKRHAANRTGAGANLLDLRVHGAGVDRTRNNGLGNLGTQIKIFCGTSLKFGFAACATEVISLFMVIGYVLGSSNIHTHTANRICSGAIFQMIHFKLVIHRAISLLDTYTPYRYLSSMQKEAKIAVLKRFKRIEGQVGGLSRMVEDGRYCIDIVTQISAVRAALRRAEEEILRDHVSHCVEHAISSGNKQDQRQKISEIIEILGRSNK